MERIIERLMYSARWLLAPMYMGMILVMIVLLVQFYQSVGYLLMNVIELDGDAVTLKVLTLIDVVLVAGLMVMVMYSGYENFVSKLELDEDTERLSWLGKMDIRSLKAKVAGSIVAISSIHLLKVFMDAENIPDSRLLWYSIIHMTFVASAFFMGMLDYYTEKKKKIKDPVTSKYV